MKRVIIIVLDGVGVGELPDAASYGDVGTNTLSHVIAAVGGLELPHLANLGLGNIPGVEGIPQESRPGASYGRMAERGAGKDSTAGHWELAGLIVEHPFPTYPEGFPKDLVHEFEARIGRKVLGNFPCSGTEILVQLGEEHLTTGRPILYTSADSVFQIAAHEEVIALGELYRMCEAARAMLTGEHAVARVIARPFVGPPGRFERTAKRRDFSLVPHGPTLLSLAAATGMRVLAIGKVFDLYAGHGITAHLPSKGNTQTIELLRQALAGDTAESAPGEIIIANLVDFDTLYGHRNDAEGFARALREFDDALPALLDGLRESDLLMITADHGNDPTTPGTDHTREHVPLLVCGPPYGGGTQETRVRAGCDLGLRTTFADLGATCAAYLQITPPSAGESFLEEIIK